MSFKIALALTVLLGTMLWTIKVNINESDSIKQHSKEAK